MDTNIRQTSLFPEYAKQLQKELPLPDEGVIAGDCVEKLKKFPTESIDLIFADPPFNIGYQYDVYDDKKSADDYLDWSELWLTEVFRVLKDSGTFWLAIGDEFAAEMKVIANRTVGFSLRSWVIWYYTFGVNCKNKFTRSHTHLFYFVKNPKSFCFHADDPEVRIPSARQLVYNDKRANPKGRLPDDTWILRPQDLDKGFLPTEDTWYFPRVAGTFKQRQGWHGCQMPEQILARIIRSCSNQEDRVLDPFAGSGTTLRVAKKLGRKAHGIELSKQYAKQVNKALKKVERGDAILGASDALTSAPSTLREEPAVKKPTKKKKASSKKPSPKKASVKKATTKKTTSKKSAVKKSVEKEPNRTAKKKTPAASKKKKSTKRKSKKS